MSFTTTTRRISRVLILASCLGATLAMAQTEPSLNEVYAAARTGNLEQAQTMVQQVLVAHPESAKAFYVRSELFARQGDLRHARESFATAQGLAPGLPFAKPEAVQALRAQLTGTSNPVAPAIATHPVAKQSNAPSPASWGLPLLLAAGVVAGGYVLFRRRPPQPMAMQAAYAYAGGPGSTDSPGIGGGAGVMQPNYGQPAYAQPGYGQAGYAPPPSNGLGGRVMGGVATGLAVGAGVVAAEAIGRNLMGRQTNSVATDNNFGDRVEPALDRNGDMGGQDFGMTDDGGGWDSSSSLDVGSGDWDT